MKRSEMLKVIRGWFYVNSLWEFGEEESETLLDTLEAHGMLPPKHIKFAPTAYAEPNKRVVYEWEPEEDK